MRDDGKKSNCNGRTRTTTVIETRFNIALIWFKCVFRMYESGRLFAPTGNASFGTTNRDGLGGAVGGIGGTGSGFGAPPRPLPPPLSLLLLMADIEMEGGAPAASALRSRCSGPSFFSFTSFFSLFPFLSFFSLSDCDTIAFAVATSFASRVGQRAARRYSSPPVPLRDRGDNAARTLGAGEPARGEIIGDRRDITSFSFSSVSSSLSGRPPTHAPPDAELPSPLPNVWHGDAMRRDITGDNDVSETEGDTLGEGDGEGEGEGEGDTDRAGDGGAGFDGGGCRCCCLGETHNDDGAGVGNLESGFRGAAAF